MLKISPEFRFIRSHQRRRIYCRQRKNYVNVAAVVQAIRNENAKIWDEDLNEDCTRTILGSWVGKQCADIILEFPIEDLLRMLRELPDTTPAYFIQKSEQARKSYESQIEKRAIRLSEKQKIQLFEKQRIVREKSKPIPAPMIQPLPVAESPNTGEWSLYRVRKFFNLDKRCKNIPCLSCGITFKSHDILKDRLCIGCGQKSHLVEHKIMC